MSEAEAESLPVTVSVENLGGISQTEVSFSPGVTVLSGDNATNRTSFLRSIMAALGSKRASLKADAEEGHVELRMGEETYRRELVRTNGRVQFSGDPYLDDPELADLFAFLLEDNDARQAVFDRGRDLRSVILQPIDTTAINAEIQQYEARKRQLDEQLAELEDLGDELPALQEDASRVEREIEDKRNTLESVREDIAAAEADLEETKQIQEALETRLEEVQSVRSEYETVSDRLESERESLAAVREERERLEDRLADLPESVEDERDRIDERLADLRDTQSSLESAVSELQNLIQFNQDQLRDEDRVVEEFAENGGSDVTAQLVDGDTVACWTCGTEVERSQIEATVDRLRESRQEKLERLREIESAIEDEQSQKATLEERRREREAVASELEATEREIEDRTETIEELETRQASLEDEIEDLEAEIEDLEFAEDHSDLLELHQDANRLEIEIERRKDNKRDIEAEIEDLEERLDKREELVAERESVADTLTDLRTRIERIEIEAVEEFNDRIEDVLGIMDYANIERIWIERREAEGGGRGGDSEMVFELHVVRSDESGTAYEDTVAHLSESEREVTGLIFALAGYLVHDVADIVPFMLLDSVEALDRERITRLVEYFEEEAEFLVIALLQDDAQALDDDYPRITEI